LNVSAVTLTLTAENNTIGGYWEVYGRSQASSEYDVDCSTTSYTDVGGSYVYTTTCVNTRSGPFFWTVYNDYGSTDSAAASVAISWSTCPTGFAGEECLYPVSSYPSTSSFNVTVRAYNISLDPDSAAWQYYYISTAANSTNEYNITCTADITSVYIYVARNAYPDDDTYVYYDTCGTVTPGEFALKAQDVFPGGTWYIAIGNYNSASAATVSVSVSSMVSTTGAASTGSATTDSTGATTGSDDNGSSSVVPSILALLLAAFALLF